jgi:uncharacterized MnhB-related membrane protein
MAYKQKMIEFIGYYLTLTSALLPSLFAGILSRTYQAAVIRGILGTLMYAGVYAILFNIYVISFEQAMGHGVPGVLDWVVYSSGICLAVGLAAAVIGTPISFFVFYIKDELWPKARKTT